MRSLKAGSSLDSALAGIGASTDAFGFAYNRRVSRFAEAFTILRTLLREGEIDFHGEFYDAERCVLHPRSPSRERAAADGRLER